MTNIGRWRRYPASRDCYRKKVEHFLLPIYHSGNVSSVATCLQAVKSSVGVEMIGTTWESHADVNGCYGGAVGTGRCLRSERISGRAKSNGRL